MTTPDAKDVRTEHGERAGWLAPIALEPSRQKVRDKATTRRVSNKGSLPMTLDAYLKLLDWTGRQIRKNKAGHIPEDCTPILQRLECSAEIWLDFVKHFHLRFRNESGLPHSRQSYRERLRSPSTNQQAT